MSDEDLKNLTAEELEELAERVQRGWTIPVPGLGVDEPLPLMPRLDLHRDRHKLVVRPGPARKA
jgi:hypothetical protein